MSGLTEAEAKKRWCPFARAPGNYAYGLPTNNRNERGGPTARAKCIGSDCMAWRWIDAEVEFQRTGTHQPTNTGYCGLAGKP
jgi:hypothetical protein